MAAADHLTATLFFGDNLSVMREHIPDESIDLTYLDPPSNSNADYNVLFEDESGRAAPDQSWRTGTHGTGGMNPNWR